MTTRIAQAGVDAKVGYIKVPVISRVSASAADPDHDPEGFGIYFKFQGLADKELLDMQNKLLLEKFAQPNAAAGGDVSIETDNSSRMMIYRPGSLDRGAEMRASRPWEQEIANAGEVRTMDVSHLADAMIDQMEKVLLRKSSVLPGTTRIFSFEDTWQLVSNLMKKKIFHHNIWAEGEEV